MRRNDLGRRRALGMSRHALVAFIVVRTGVAALAGGLIGVLAGTVALALLGTAVPPLFVAAIGVLAVIAALAASIPPALAAAYSDPVRVLRTP
ncbi:FtsX-like permease family protein [Microbacterium helvum]|nr:FtsX-like permease family protein [Microbacterium helvum]